ncbi:unnamed protein product, partial [Polarella glacialis]
ECEPVEQPDWDGNAESRYAALLKALGEEEAPDDQDCLGSWSSAVLPKASASSAAFAFPRPDLNVIGDCEPVIPPDWDGNAESRYAALLKALGEEEEPDDQDCSGLWSSAVLPKASASSAAFSFPQPSLNVLGECEPVVPPDLDGNVESRYAALLKALGEEEAPE